MGLLITEEARAKVNLHLRVLGTRPDHYHELQSYMQTLALADLLTLERNNDGLLLKTSSTTVPTDESNLALRAAKLFCEHFRLTPNFTIHLHKEIPVGAGLGGGSADAAAVLRLFARYLRTEEGLSLPLSLLRELGRQLGADVPFLVEGGCAYCAGIGDELKQLPDLKASTVLLVKPVSSISSAGAYRKLDESRRLIPTAATAEQLRSLDKALLAADWSSLQYRFRNDFWPSAVTDLPILQRILSKLYSSGAQYAAMSGSGSALFALFDQTAEAESCLARLQASPALHGSFFALTHFAPAFTHI